jgi:hypothetical protein
MARQWGPPGSRLEIIGGRATLFFPFERCANFAWVARIGGP